MNQINYALGALFSGVFVYLILWFWVQAVPPSMRRKPKAGKKNSSKKNKKRA